MSQWTHINGSIRFDSIFGQGKPTEKELGKICRFDDEDTSHWKNSKLPCGSEGSIEYTIVKTGEENSVASTVVVFTGDLRDYDDFKEIIMYFNNIVKNKMIRSGIIEIEVEGADPLILRYIFNEKSFIIINK